MDDYSSEVSEDPITSLLSLRSYCLAVQKHTLKDGCEAQTKTSQSKCTQWAITWSWETITFFFYLISYLSECSFNSLSIMPLSSESTQPQARISSHSSFHSSSFSLLYPTNPDRLGLCLPHEWINIFISTLSQFSIKDEYSFARPIWGAVNHRAPAGPFSSTCVCHSFYDHTSLQGMLKKTHTNTYNLCNTNLLY